MSRAPRDTTPRFDAFKSYAIGTLQAMVNDPKEVPSGFAKSPFPVVRLNGSDLLHLKIRSCRDYLLSSLCKFKQGSVVHFYEVNILDGDEEYILIHSGMPLNASQGLSDGGSVVKHGEEVGSAKDINIHNIMPSNATGAEKLLWNSNKEQIQYLQKSLEQERASFVKERKDLLERINLLNDEKISLNLRINEISAESKMWEMKYTEAQLYMDRLSQQPVSHNDEPQGLADKMKNVLSDETTMSLISQGISLFAPLMLAVQNKLVTSLGGVPTPPSPQPVYSASPQVSHVYQPPASAVNESDDEAELRRILNNGN